MPRRGQYLESQIDKVIDYINNTSGFATKLHPERNFDGLYIKGEPFDYIALMDKYKCVFDAKEVKGNTWHMVAKDIKQTDNLKRCKNTGLEAYFLILFEGKYLKQVNVDDVIEVLKAGKKSVSKELGKEWELLKRLKTT